MCSRHEPGDIYECHKRDIESITEPNKPSSFVSSINIEHPCHLICLIGHDSNTLAIESGEANYYVGSEIMVHSQEFAVIDHLRDDVHNVVWLISFVRHNTSER